MRAVVQRLGGLCGGGGGGRGERVVVRTWSVGEAEEAALTAGKSEVQAGAGDGTVDGSEGEGSGRGFSWLLRRTTHPLR